MEYLYCSLLGYFAGSFNPSYLFAKFKGIDIRTKGSNNAGASNALMIFGKAVGFICALLDIAKAYFIIKLSKLLFPAFVQAFAVTGAACVIGHVYPFYMNFRGGKGLACLGGMILCYDWRVFLIMLTCAVMIALITDYICFVPITASCVFPIVYGIMTHDIIGTFILFIMTAVMLFKHRENIRRIRLGKEVHLSFLWKPQSEMERLKNNLSVSDDELAEHFSAGDK